MKSEQTTRLYPCTFVQKRTKQNKKHTPVQESMKRIWKVLRTSQGYESSNQTPKEQDVEEYHDTGTPTKPPKGSSAELK